MPPYGGHRLAFRGAVLRFVRVVTSLATRSDNRLP
jgi:hypothetical protein